MRGAAWATPTALLAVGAPAMAVSNGGCQDPGTVFDAQSRGRLLSGAIGGVNLDAVAAIEGAHAQAVAGTPTDTESAALTVSALQAIQLNLGSLTGALSSILDLVAGQNAGVVNQFAYANEAAEGVGTGEIGASGAVNQSTGAITLHAGDASAPTLGTVDLRSLLQQATGLPGVADLVASVSQLQLQIGAVAGIAEFDSLCTQVDEDEVDRDYLVAYLRLLVASDVVGAITSAVPATLNVSTDAIWSVLQGVPLLGSLLSALGKNALTVTATVDTNALKSTPIPQSGNPALQLDLSKGTVLIDVASLLGGAYQGGISGWLNQQNPNTRLFVDAPLPADAVATIVNTLANDLKTRLTQVINVTIKAGNTTGTLPTGLLVQATLASLLNGTATATFVLAGIPINLGAALSPLLKSLGSVVETALNTLFAPNGAITTALSGLSGLLTTLFGVLQGVLAITVNAQNVALGSMPSYYRAISPSGRYDVGALHLQILGIANLLDLSLGRGSVGENTPR
ncbi:choice-of-anchor G family protein [Brachybacterium halotolerans subsp. kimchii]|uniref:choice-of-anchor G family protein n=1 Tax=Brachybacterium halotolerans TaxID=2795215 RepID=UPI001E5B0177|nr:choice-of-anchor G family protein [Brachybacterium halotolerans]UEJ81111.1 choice-of-anchor G family protein [Brachybacterium halotolerans subsp. kimchii]